MDLLTVLKLPPPKALRTAQKARVAQAAMPAKAGATAVVPSGRQGRDAAPAQAQADAVSGPPPVTVGQAMAPVDMKDEDIAAAIMDKQVAILVGWQTALLVFDKTMTSSADAEAKPDYQNVIVKYFAEKLAGALMKHVPGSSELDAVVKSLEGEYTRAATAGASATLRDFVNQHHKSIGKVHQATLAQRQGFISAVRARREKVEAALAARPLPKGTKSAMLEPTQEDNDYAMMRMALLDTLEAVDKTLSASTEEALFRVLSEQWISMATVYAGMGISVSAVVIIRLNPDYSMRNAHIQGDGGQKLAEQLLKDSPNGMVDVFKLKARRRIVRFGDKGAAQDVLNLDANNKDLSTGAYAEGDSGSLKRYVMSKGLPPTNKLTGD